MKKFEDVTLTHKDYMQLLSYCGEYTALIDQLYQDPEQEIPEAPAKIREVSRFILALTDKTDEVAVCNSN